MARRHVCRWPRSSACLDTRRRGRTRSQGQRHDDCRDADAQGAMRPTRRRSIRRSCSAIRPSPAHHMYMSKFKAGSFSEPHFHPNDRFITVAQRHLVRRHRQQLGQRTPRSGFKAAARGRISPRRSTTYSATDDGAVSCSSPAKNRRPTSSNDGDWSRSAQLRALLRCASKRCAPGGCAKSPRPLARSHEGMLDVRRLRHVASRAALRYAQMSFSGRGTLVLLPASR